MVSASAELVGGGRRGLSGSPAQYGTCRVARGDTMFDVSDGGGTRNPAMPAPK